MEDPAVVGKFSAFSVKLYVPFLKNACAFVLPFRSSGVLACPHAEEKCTCDQLTDGCVQVCVSPLVNLQD